MAVYERIYLQLFETREHASNMSPVEITLLPLTGGVELLKFSEFRVASPVKYTS